MATFEALDLADRIRNNARRTPRWSWMPSGWLQSSALGATAGGTAFLTIGVPDDFYAVRVGFANITTTPWAVTKVIASGLPAWGDYSQQADTAKWATLTFQNAGADVSNIVTAVGAPTAITVAANATDASTGETTNPAWTFTDWVPCRSSGADPATGMRVLTLRALVPSSQTITFANGLFSGWFGVPTIHLGYDVMVGGLKNNDNRVTTPTSAAVGTAATLQANALVNGSMMPLVQVITRSGGVTVMATGDSHHMGSSTTSQFTSCIQRAVCSLGKDRLGTIPVGFVSVAVGGQTSQHIFPRLHTLLGPVSPGVVVEPGWTFNEMNGAVPADQIACDRYSARLAQSIVRCRESGAIPVTLTPFPRDAASMTSVQVAPWLALRSDILAMALSGDEIVDATPLLGRVSSGVLDGTYLPGLSSDAIHPNDAGHQIVATALKSALQRVC